MTCPGSGRIPLFGGSLPVDGQLDHRVLCLECGQWFPLDLSQPGGMSLPKHDRTPRGRLV